MMPGRDSDPSTWRTGLIAPSNKKQVYCASVTHFPPTERKVNSPERRGRRGGSAGRGEWSCVDRWEGGRKLEGEDVASDTEEAKAA
jgi:hypothetical protein